MADKGIIIDGRWLSPEMRGIGVFTLNFLKALSHSNFNGLVFSVAIKKKNFAYARSELGDKFNFILLPNAPDPILDLIIFPYIILRDRYSLIHYTGNTGFLYKFGRSKSIITLHDVSFLKSSKLIPRSYKCKQFIGRLYRSFFIKFFLKSSSSVVTVSNFAMNDIQHYFPNIKRLSYVYHGVDFDRLTILEPTIKNNNYLIISGIDPQKNLQRIIDAFIKFKLKFDTNCCLTVIGVHESEYKFYNPKYSNYDFINFLGYQNHKETLALLHSSKCLIIGSLYESFCLPIIEAMSMSVDVIASSNGAIPEIGKDYIKLYFNPYNVESIYSAIILYENVSYSDNSFISDDIYVKYSWERVVEHYLKEYRYILSSSTYSDDHSRD